MKVGNKQNSFLNGEWAKHGRSFGKKVASKKRRIIGKNDIQKNLTEFFNKNLDNSK